uniref:EF-hand domain-containing protein n=1 Tax=Kryptolebias marmoratus TaxID=37003 RepID=A0A3Q3AJK4_KRYMA
SQVGKLIKLFDEVDVDQSGGLDVDEFTQFLHRIDSSLSKDSILALHIKIDLNCDGSPRFLPLLKLV